MLAAHAEMESERKKDLDALYVLWAELEISAGHGLNFRTR